LKIVDGDDEKAVAVGRAISPARRHGASRGPDPFRGGRLAENTVKRCANENSMGRGRWISPEDIAERPAGVAFPRCHSAPEYFQGGHRPPLGETPCPHRWGVFKFHGRRIHGPSKFSGDSKNYSGARRIRVYFVPTTAGRSCATRATPSSVDALRSRIICAGTNRRGRGRPLQAVFLRASPNRTATLAEGQARHRPCAACEEFQATLRKGMNSGSRSIALLCFLARITLGMIRRAWA